MHHAAQAGRGPMSSRRREASRRLRGIAFAVLVLLVASVAVTASARGQDDEPGGSRASAAGPLSGGEDVVGSVGESDEDWFFFYAREPGTVRLTVTGVPTEGQACQSGAGLVVTLGGRSREFLGKALPDCGQTEVVQAMLPRRGRYFIEIAGNGPRYRIRIDPPEVLSPTAVARQASGLTVTRARVSRANRMLHVEGSISPHLRGVLIGRFESSAGRTSFEQDLGSASGEFRIRQPLTATQAKRGRGSVLLQHTGSGVVRGDSVRVNADARSAGLRIDEAALVTGVTDPRAPGDEFERLRVSGTASPQVEGLLRMILRWTDHEATEHSTELRAHIRNGRWEYDRILNFDLTNRVGPLQLSVRYTGARTQRTSGAVQVIDVSNLDVSGVRARTPPSGPPRLTLKSRISFAGIGPVRIGMTPNEAERAGRRAVAFGAEVNPGCAGDTFDPERYGLSTLTINGRIQELAVSQRGIATTRGIRVGDSVARLRRVYGSSLHRGPLTPGLTRGYELRSGTNEIQFRITGQRVRAIATGTRPTIDRFEGCV